jgi:hypothetical protein
MYFGGAGTRIGKKKTSFNIWPFIGYKFEELKPKISVPLFTHVFVELMLQGDWEGVEC